VAGRSVHTGVWKRDSIARVWADPHGMTVADVDALLYLPGHDRAGVTRALQLKALSPGWQGSFRPCWVLPRAQQATQD
jgi:hypothetical protein